MSKQTADGPPGFMPDEKLRNSKLRIRKVNGSVSSHSQGSARLWFDELPPVSIDSYVELREAFLAKSMHVKRASECMRVFGFLHGITNPDLIKRLNDNIPKSVDEMKSATTTFLRGEVVIANQSRQKGPPSWKHYEAAHKPNFNRKLNFKNRPRREPEQEQVLRVSRGQRPQHRQVNSLEETDQKRIQIRIIVTLNQGVEAREQQGRTPKSYQKRKNLQQREGPDNIHGATMAVGPIPSEPTTNKGIKVAIHTEYPEQTVTIGEILSEKGRMELCNLLNDNMDTSFNVLGDCRFTIASAFFGHALITFVVMTWPRNTPSSAPKKNSKWAFELGAHDISYKPRTLVRGQILVDFITEKPVEDASLMRRLV
nr:reverse transcriptase domain-containing protein [Tanacetum cinerariifolium]